MIRADFRWVRLVLGLSPGERQRLGVYRTHDQQEATDRGGLPVTFETGIRLATSAAEGGRLLT
jgi:hypothetical protein